MPSADVIDHASTSIAAISDEIAVAVEQRSHGEEQDASFNVDEESKLGLEREGTGPALEEEKERKESGVEEEAKQTEDKHVQLLQKKKRKAQIYAGGGSGGVKPCRPMLPGEWKPGMPCHWQESTRSNSAKFYLIRVLNLLHIGAATTYLQYRGRNTVGFVTKDPWLVAYQIAFFAMEVISITQLLFNVIQTWCVTHRNSVNFKQIPNELLDTTFAYGRRRQVPPEKSNWPSVGVYIPCYNEDVGLVRQTVVGALAMEYPTELLTVYLCDDGKDDAKLEMISELRRGGNHRNLFYFIRPDNSHAKAGNLNYAIAKTESDLIVTLDADFIARPNLLERLVPYYYNWNSETSMYEFNDSLGVVQTPQHFRNLSPYDSDPLDQRSTLFSDVIMPGKDWFNASTMIGTTNLLNRIPAKEVGYYPYHSVTEDTAMSLAFHSAGYRTYYVNESLAHGLACTSLWSNIVQRARWLKGDWQILFHLRTGPAFCKGLSVIQRLCYLNMSLSRLISVVNLFYEIALFLLLVFAISPLDAMDPERFIYHILPFLVLGIVSRSILVSGGGGLDKSESAIVAFEVIFRYYVITGFFIALFRGKNLKFQVTDKGPVGDSVRDLEKVDPGGSRSTILGLDDSRAPGLKSSNRKRANGVSSEFDDNLSDDQSNERFVDSSWSNRIKHSSGTSTSSSELRPDSSGNRENQSNSLKPARKTYPNLSPTEKAVRRTDIMKNLGKVWFNVFMAGLLTFSIVWGVLYPPVPRTLDRITIDGITYEVQYSNVLPISLAIGFAGMNILAHFLAIALVFRPYTKGWMMDDFVHGRCDKYAVSPKTGKLFVPWSYISLLNVARGILLTGSIASLLFFVYGPEGGVILNPLT